MRLVRAILLFKAGAYAGMVTAAAVMKRALPSRGDEESDELALVAIFDGAKLKSRARAFRGGSLLAWFGGVAVDLREAELAPDAHLNVTAILGGVAVRIPEGWRVESRVKAIAGGVDVKHSASEDADARTLTLDGFAFLGGIAVGPRVADADLER